MTSKKKPPRKTSARAKAKALLQPKQFDSADIERLRTILNPCRERFGFDFTMRRWSDLVWESRSDYERQTKEQARGRGRPYDDSGRYAALLLGVIFEEYTGRLPGRTTRWREKDTKLRDKTHPFSRFCREACNAIGMKDASDKAFREAVDEVKRRGLVEANVFALRWQLWGGSEMADAEYGQVRRRFSQALDAVAEGKLLSNTLPAGSSEQTTVRSALIDAVHLRERLDDEELGKAGRALDRLVRLRRKGQIAEIIFNLKRSEKSADQ
jgi:hypothetical protein